MSKDIYMSVDDLAPDNIATMASRLEARAAMAGFAAMRDDYFERLALASEGAQSDAF